MEICGILNFDWTNFGISYFTLLFLVILELLLSNDNILFLHQCTANISRKKGYIIKTLGFLGAILLRIVSLYTIGYLLSINNELNILSYKTTIGHLVLLIGALFLLSKGVNLLIKVPHIKIPHGEIPSRITTIEKNAHITILQIIITDAIFSIDSIFAGLSVTNYISMLTISILISFILVFLLLRVKNIVNTFLNNNPTIKKIEASLLLSCGVILILRSTDTITIANIEMVALPLLLIIVIATICRYLEKNNNTNLLTDENQ